MISQQDFVNRQLLFYLTEKVDELLCNPTSIVSDQPGFDNAATGIESNKAHVQQEDTFQTK